MGKSTIFKIETPFLEAEYQDKYDHTDPKINFLIEILKKEPEARTGPELNSLRAYISKIPFFAEQGISDKNILDMCELMTYKFYE